MKERNYTPVKNLLKVLVLFLGLTLLGEDASAQKRVTIEWDYTLNTGLSCKYPMVIRIYFFADTIGYDFAIFKHPSWSSTDGYPNHSSSRSYSFIMPEGGTISTMRIAAGYVNNEGKCPSLPSGRLCYTGGVFEINRNESDYCVWRETAPALCGLSGFKVRVNVSPLSGTPIVQQGTIKPTYCPGENITFEAPCNLRGRGWTLYWYYQEGSSSMRFLKSTTSETLTVGDGQDYTPKPGVNTYLYVSGGPYGFSSEISGSFRYGPRPPTATVNPRPPKCAGGTDWAIELNNASSPDGFTQFKANIFHSANSSVFPDGFITFTGSTGTLDKDDISSGRVFVPGTSFRMTFVNDGEVCETNLGSYVIPDTPKLTAGEITASHKDLSCYNQLTGEFQLNVSNGDGNYTVKLNDVTYPVKAGSPTHQPVIEKLDGGIYTVKVTDTNCAADPITVTLTEPAELTASIEIIKGLDCFNSTDGRLNVNITGGISPYTIAWSNGNNTALATGLSKGTHTVNVTDQGCPTLMRAQPLTAPDSMIITLAGTSPKCPGGGDGRMKVSNLQNAPGIIEYSWDTGGTTDEIIALTSGTYTVTITSKDAGKTCVATASEDLEDPDPWTATIIPALAYNGSAIKCNGDENGRLDVVVRNDLGQVVDGEYYTWSTGENGASKKFIDQLPEGLYEITVRYQGVCEVTSSYPLIDPEPVSATILPNSNYNGQLISCHNKMDASLRGSAVGGTGLPAAYTYTWNTGTVNTVLSGIGAGDYSITVLDANGCAGYDTVTVDNPEPVEGQIVSSSDYSGYGVSCAGKSDGYITAGGLGGTNDFSYAWSTGSTTAFIDRLATGLYTVTVSDNNGCTAAVVGHTITTPAALTVRVGSKQNVACFNGSDGRIVLQPTGGADNYTYSKDSLSWQPEPAFETLRKGAYKLYVRDGNGCFNKVSESLTEPPVIDIAFKDIEPAYCADPVGKATSIVTGGVGSYRYEWTREGQPQVISTAVTLSNVAAGIYRLLIRDGNNCPADSIVPITSTDGASATYTSVNTKCFDSSDGSALITITDGEGPFTVQWPDGHTTLDGVGLKRGIYNVLITDRRECTIIQPVEVLAPAPLELSVQSETIPTCHTFCDGAITLEAIGGVGGYVYEWNGKTGPAQTQLCARVYSVVLTDANNCLLTEDVELRQPAAIDVLITKETLSTCRDGCDGALEVAATGGNGGYQYQWASGGNTNIKNNICPGMHNLLITDMKGCTGDMSVTLNNTAPLPLDLGGGVTLCVGQTYVLDAGANWTSVKWGSSTGLASVQQSVTVKDPARYWVEVLSDKGCVGQDTFLLETSYDLLQASFMIPEEAVAGDTVVMIDISWPLPQAVEWSYPEAMTEVLNLGDVLFGQFDEAGTYEVALTAHLGECVDQISKFITILETEEGSEGGRLGYEKFVKTFTLHPNPTTGAFEVEVELLEESTVTLSVWNSPTGILIKQVQRDGKNLYVVPFDLRPLVSGTYLLRLDHARGKEYIRFIVY